MYRHKSIGGGLLRAPFGFIQLTALDVQAETVYYTLDNVILDDQTQMTGIFLWTYEIDDFENGSGQFISLSIPWTSHNQDDLISTIEPTQIEISFDGNVHDDGVDIKLVLKQALMPNASSLIDTNTAASKYSIGGNGFHDGFFLSGRISPIPTLSMAADPSGFVLVLGTGYSGLRASGSVQSLHQLGGLGQRKHESHYCPRHGADPVLSTEKALVAWLLHKHAFD